MKQFYKKISLLLVIAAGTSIASEGPLPTLFPGIQKKITYELIKDAVAYIHNFIKLTYTFRDHTSFMFYAEFSPDGSKIVSASADKKVKIRSVVQIGREVFTLRDYATLFNTHIDFVYSAKFSHDGSKIVSASADGTVKIWNAKTYKLIQILQHGGKVYSAKFSHDGSKIVSVSSDGTVKIWNAKTYKLIQILQHGGNVRFAEFSPDGSKIVSSSEDETVKIWNARTYKFIQVLQHGHGGGVFSAKFSHDGSKIVSASADGTVKIWNAKTYKLIQILQHGKRVIFFTEFSHDGSKIVSASADGTVKIWNAKTYKLIQILQHGHGGGVFSAKFSPNDSKVVSASLLNKTVKIWDLQPELKKQVFNWFASDLRPDQAVIIKRAYEVKLRGKKLYLKDDGVDTFNTMPDYVRSLLIDYLDIIPPESKSKSD